HDPSPLPSGRAVQEGDRVAGPDRDRALGLADAKDRAVRGAPQHLPFVLERVTLGQDDLRLVAPGDRIVVAGTDPLHGVLLDAVVEAGAGQGEEAPGLAAGFG